jgi:hypothetical protein
MRNVYADLKGLPVLALPLYASSRCHFILQGTLSDVTGSEWTV